jgi:pilus assembly protein FimV
MYISCHECNTVFRLDERRLKPAGSKVRCSRCGNIFTAFPQAPGTDMQPPVLATESAPAIPAVTPSPPQPVSRVETESARVPNQLEGIDLAALNSILDKPFHDPKASEPRTETDEGELDLDFDMDLAGTGANAPPSLPVADSTADSFDDADLEMDFEIDDGMDEQTAPAIASRDVLAEDLAAHAKSNTADIPSADEIGTDSGDRKVDHPTDDGSGLDLSVDNLELDLDFSLEEHAIELPSSDKPSMTRESAAPPSVKPADPEEGDLDLTDLGDLLEDADPGPPREISEEELELDLAGDKAQPASAHNPSGKDPARGDSLAGILDPGDEIAPQDEEEIDELDLSFDLAEDIPRKQVAASPGDDFDLGDLAAVLEQDDSGQVVDDEPEEVDLELDDSDKKVPPAQTDSVDELDLGDLDDFLSEKSPKDDVFELDEAPAGDAAEESDEDLEELDFQLDAEFEDKPIAKQEKGIEFSQDEPELDLSDIEKMLEGDGLTVKPGAGEDNEAAGFKDLGDLGEIDLGEIDLDDIGEAIDSDDESALEPIFDRDEPELALSIGGKDVEAPKETSEDPMDLDLDIVATMAPISQKTNGADNEVPISENDDLTFDLEMESEAAPAAKTVQPFTAAEDEFDLSDLGDLVEESDKRPETIDTGDIELEFEIEDAAEPIIAQTSARVSRPVNEMAAARSETAEPVKKAVGRPKPVKKKKGAGKFLVLLLVLAALGAGGYYGYDYVLKNDVQVPYLSQYINPKPVDPDGIAQLSTSDINSKFIENEQSGRLFVITGNVRNGYPDTRSMIQLRGKLYSTGKILVKSEQAFAGQVLSDQELATKPIAEITQQLAKAPGSQIATSRVLSGQTLPFMVVFSELPENLDEFAIETVRSQKAQ